MGSEWKLQSELVSVQTERLLKYPPEETEREAVALEAQRWNVNVAIACVCER